MLDTQELLERQREIQDKISIKLKQSHYKELSNKILDGLDNLLSKGPTAEVRWIWELIQNAKDASIGQNQVKIVIETSNEQVIFSHSGNPFTLDDIFSIVNQTSSKNRMDMDQNIDEDDDAIPETTGKFGTGFITTHLLSRVIYLKSIYQSYDTKTQSNNYRRFQLRLDRSARTLKQFVEEYDRLFGIFNSLADPTQCPLTQFELGDISTSFTYPLVDDHSRGVMEQGLKNFRETAALVLAFNHRIHSVRVNEEIYARLEECVITVDCKRIVIINGNNEQIKQIILLQEKLVQLAFETRFHSNRYTIIQKKQTSPGLFSDFPLIGSHEFIFPCIINSHLFWPNEERSSIILKQSSRSKVNQQILNRGIQLVMKFFVNTVQNQHLWLDIENLCRIAIPFNADANWYEQTLIQPYLQLVQLSQFIQCNTKQKLALNQIVLPDIRGHDQEQGSKYYQLIQPFHSNLIIWDFENIQRWFEIFELSPLWNTILNLDSRLLTFKNITITIENSKTLSNFAALYFQGNINTAERYLELLYSYITQFLKQQDWIDQEIFVNQIGEFKKYQLLKKDSDSMDESYKEILEMVNQAPRSWLFQKTIDLNSFAQFQMGIWTFSDCVKSLVEIIQNPLVQESLRLLIACKTVKLTDIHPPSNHVKFMDLFFQFYQGQDKLITSVALFNIELYKQCQRYILRYICDQIYINYTSLQLLQQVLKVDLNESKRWIGVLYSFIVELFETAQWFQFKIFLNQNNTFDFYNNLSRDVDRVDEIYKELLTSINQDQRDKLFNNDVDLQALNKFAMGSLTFKDFIKVLESELLQKNFGCNKQKSFILAKELITLNSKADNTQTETNQQFRTWIDQFDNLPPIRNVMIFDQRLTSIAQEVILIYVCLHIHEKWSSISELQQKICLGKNDCTRQLNCSHSLNWIEFLYYYMHYFTPFGDERKYRSYKVFLNQNRQFKLLDYLSQDIDNVDDVYKDILTNNNDKIRDYLLFNDINIYLFKQYIKQISFRSICEKLTKLVTLQTEYLPTNAFLTRQPVKNPNPNFISEQQILLISNQIIDLVPKTLDNSISSQEQFHQWLSLFSKRAPRVLVVQHSSQLYKKCQFIVVNNLVEKIKQLNTVRQLNKMIQDYGINKWLSQLYQYIQDFKPFDQIGYGGIIPNQEGAFIKFEHHAEIDVTLECPDVTDLTISQEIMIYAKALLDADKKITKYLVEKEFNKQLNNIISQKCTLQSITMQLDQQIMLNSTKVDYMTKNTQIIYKLDEISKSGFKDSKFMTYFPHFYGNGSKYLGFIVANNPQITNSLGLIFGKTGGTEILGALSLLNQNEITKIKDIVCNPVKEKMFKQFSELFDQNQPELQVLLQDKEKMQQFMKSYIESQNQNRQVEVEVARQPPEIQIQQVINSPSVVSNEELELSQMEAQFMQNENSYFEQNLITNQVALIEVLKIKKYTIKFQQFIQNRAQTAFNHVIAIIERSIIKVKEALSAHPDYDISQWTVDPYASNKNIIKGIKKYGQTIIIVIRPTDGQFIRFHEASETNALMEPLSELWGNNQYGQTQQITLGKMIRWNSINQFTVKN